MEEYFEKRKDYIDGYDAGIEQKQREMVLEMHDNDEPLEKISKYTKLTLEEIQTIIADSKKRIK